MGRDNQRTDNEKREGGKVFHAVKMHPFNRNSNKPATNLSSELNARANKKPRTCVRGFLGLWAILDSNQ